MQIKTKNINCQSCVNLIKASLEDDFGFMQIDIKNKTIDIKKKRALIRGSLLCADDTLIRGTTANMNTP